MDHPIDHIKLDKITDFCELLEKTNYFDSSEIRIIKSFLKLKQNMNVIQCTAVDISRRASMSITNVYKYLYNLEKKGIIESTKAAKGEKITGNKEFWLTDSTNPFPRILSQIGNDYLIKKDIFSQLERDFENIRPGGGVWQGNKVYENYEENYVNRAAMLFDMAKDEIMITTEKFFDNYIILDSLKRAVARRVVVKIIAEEINPTVSKKLMEIGVEMKLGYGWPYIMLIDGCHGITVDRKDKGVWFLNYTAEYKDKFMEFWEKSEKI